MIDFWNLRQRLMSKNWPKEDQKFSKFKFFDWDNKDYNERSKIDF